MVYERLSGLPPYPLCLIIGPLIRGRGLQSTHAHLSQENRINRSPGLE